MAFPLAWTVLAGVLLVTPLLCSLIIRRYADPEDRTCMTTGASSMAIALALLCILLVPVDIYTVSSGTSSSTGLQSHPGDVRDAGSSLKDLYYALYAALFAFAFVFMPFAYFYFEEGDDERVRTRSRACAALGYTGGFVFLFAGLLAIGVIAKKDNFNGGKKHGGGDHWKSALQDDFSDGDAMVAFVVGALAILGLFGWVVYVAYGMAYLPVGLMRRADAGEMHAAQVASSRKGRLVADGSARRPLMSGAAGASSSSDSARLQLLRARAEIEHLDKKYGAASQREWSARDRAKYSKAQSDERRLAPRVEREDARAAGSSGASSSSSAAGGPAARRGRSAPDDPYSRAADRCTRCMAGCWNAVAPVRILIGAVLLLLSLLVVVSLVLSQVDKLEHSECGASCGYTVGSPSIVNPVDKVLGFVSPYFPADYAFFGGLTLYLFACGLAGLVALGVRLLCWRLYSISPGNTMPNALLMGSWLLMFTVLLLNMQLLNLSPQYVTFGEQQYLDEHKSLQPCTLDLCYGNGTAVHHGGTAPSRPGNCSATLWEGYTDEQAEPGHLCVMTQVSRFILSTQLALPFYGVVYFFANFLFVAVFLVSLLCVAVRKPGAGGGGERVYEF